jgi:hypothetical protein
MVRACSSHRRRFAASVHCPEDALAALAAATGHGRDPCVAVGALAVDRRPVALVVVEDATASDLPTVVDVVLGATRGVAAAVFVASCGAGPGAGVPDAGLFGAVERLCGRAGVELLEWFVPAGGAWVAVGEVRGRSWRW